MIRPLRAAPPCVLAAVGALAFTAPAHAHAYLLRSSPAVGATVAKSPPRVVLVFSEAVAPLAGTDVLGPRHTSALDGRPYVPAGRQTTIVLPLAPRLRGGRYLVRWREVDRQDGHQLGGSFEFAVGPGVAVRRVAASSSTAFSLRMTAARWLLILAVLVAGGFVVFRRLVLLRSPDEAELRAREVRASAVTLAIALAGVVMGAAVLVALEPGPGSTAYTRRLVAGGAVAAIGVIAALVARRRTGVLVVAELAALVVLVLPSATGHAVGRTHGEALSLADDLVHVVAAAVWLGGVAGLAIVAPALLRPLDPAARRAALAGMARRFAPLALWAVGLIALTGLLRAVQQLGAASELWTTGYGRALIVKTALLAAAVGLAACNRNRLGLRAFRRELGVLAVLIGAVAVLTDLAPRASPATAATAARGSPVALAGRVGDVAVGVSVAPRDTRTVRVRATVIGQQGPLSGLPVRFLTPTGTQPAHSCGSGCYAAVVALTGGRPRLAVSLGTPARTAHFRVPASWPAPDATTILRRVEATWRGLQGLSATTRIASDPQHEVTTSWRYRAPDRLAYQNLPAGSQAIVVGRRRWDRASPRGRWQESAQEPVRQPAPPWSRGAGDAHLLGSQTVGGRRLLRVSFVDRTAPAWFTILVDPATYRTERVDMIAQAHFMRQENRGFDAPRPIEPPA